VISVSPSLPAVFGWPALRRQLLAEKARGGRGLDEKQLGAVFTAGAWSVQGGRFVLGRATLFFTIILVLRKRVIDDCDLPEKRQLYRMRALGVGPDDLRWVCMRVLSRMVVTRRDHAGGQYVHRDEP